MNRLGSFVAASFIGLAGCAAGQGASVDATAAFRCVDNVFSRTVPRATPLAADRDLSLDSIHELGARLPAPLAQALIAAANDASAVAPKGGRDPKAYYLLFIDKLGIELPRYIPIDACGDADDSDGTLFQAAINGYLGDVVGKGRMRQWFVDNGGEYVKTHFVAALVGLELTGRDVDLNAWKQYYTVYVNAKFHK